MNIPKHIPELDVLRGAAVLFVMIYHMNKDVPHLHLFPTFRYGFTGVDLFFVLSGFLITGILLRSKEKAGYFVNFYARRLLRIWPLYFALLAFAFLVVPLLQPHLSPTVLEQSRPWQAYPLFLQNFLVPDAGSFGPLQITWSLCVEEQFYMFWPPLIFLIPVKHIRWVALSAILVSISLRLATAQHLLGLDIYLNTFCRMDGLAMGSLAAVLLPKYSERAVRRFGWIAGSVSAAALGAIIGLGILNWMLFTFVSLLFVSLLGLAINNPAISKLTFLSYTGTISYGLYLLHAPAYDIIRTPRIRLLLGGIIHNAVANDLAAFCLSLALAYAFAFLSWKMLESPILTLKKYFENRRIVSQPSQPQEERDLVEV